MATTPRSFVLRHAGLRPVPALEDIRLHLADDALALWHATQVETGDPDTPIPFWAFAWGGGLALARHIGEHPELIRARRVLDLASGSGVCAIAAARAGAASVVAVDIDPLAVAAIGLNARANGVRVAVLRRDLLDGPPPGVDLVLAGDCCYEARLAARVVPWLRTAQAAGVDVLLGDPGRRYLPVADLEEVARYPVRTTTDLEDLAYRQAAVFRLRGDVSPG